ncbi:MAG: enolase C-terminal domain-like protein [Microbacteriaceae bacterium]
MPRIAHAEITDVRYPTSLELDGSDAVNVDPDHSAAYLQLSVDDPSWPVGHAFTFTGGRGNEVMCAAIASVLEFLPDWDVENMLSRLGEISRLLVHDSQFRWIGPEKGVSHMAAGTVLSALWDIKAKRAGLPLWKLLASLTPEELVAVVDFSHIRDALTEDEALQLLRAGQAGKAERIAELDAHGFPGYTTAPGWLGYSDEKMQRLAKEAVAEGFTLIKMKVAGDVEDDKRRMRLVREAVGPDIRVAVDANQRWEVDEAGPWINRLQEFNLWWVEEPTSPDDILGHARIRKEIAPIKVATGEAVQNRIVFKQLLQAGSIDVMQIDSTRVAGPNENIANLLLAAKFGVPVCPHAGGVGLCELVQHYSFFDYAVVGRSREGRVIEYVDHLHEHFVSPVVLRDGQYLAPTAPGIGAEMLSESITRWTYPDGPGWSALRADGLVS